MTEWNTQGSSATQPINISSSYNNEYDDARREYSTPLNDSNDLGVKFNNLTVGSLPSIRRERRLIVSSGNHEFMSNGVVNNTGQRSPSVHGRRRNSGVGLVGIGGGLASRRASSRSRRRKQHSDSSLIHQMQLMANPSSLPVPSAPFLASRNDQASDDRFSRIPNIALPESASESFSSKSVPYGSLNESKFRFPNGSSYHNINDNLSASYNPNQGSTYNLQQRVEKMRKNGTLIKNQTKSGIAALLGESNNDDNEREKIQNDALSTNPKKSLGIGALLNEFGENEKTTATNRSSLHNVSSRKSLSTPSSIDIGSNNTNTSMLSMSIQSQSITTSHYLDSNPISTNQAGTVMIPNSHNQMPYDNNSDDANSNPSNFEISPNTQICGSLTGLDILKQTPRGMAKLNAEETKAILDIQARSRSYSDDVKNILNDKSDSITHGGYGLNSRQQDYYSVDHHEDINTIYQYSAESSPQRRLSNASDSSLNHNDQIFHHDPDIDGAFDLDMDS